MYIYIYIHTFIYIYHLLSLKYTIPNKKLQLIIILSVAVRNAYGLALYAGAGSTKPNTTRNYYIVKHVCLVTTIIMSASMTASSNNTREHDVGYASHTPSNLLWLCFTHTY
jgi:hypothetical protein